MQVSELLNKGEALFRSCAFPEAEALFLRAQDAAKRAGNSSPTAALGLARVRIAQGNFSAARPLLDRLIQDSPSEAEPLTCKGVLEEREGHLARAVELYQRAVNVNPGSAVAQFNLGRALAQQRRWRDSIRALRSAVELDPAHLGYLYFLGTALQSSGKTAEAIEVFRSCVERDPKNLDAWITLADVLVFAGESELADQLLSECATRFPDAGVVQSKRAAIATRNNDLPSAIRHLERQTDVEPKNENAWLTLSVLHLMMLDLESADRSVRRALEVNPRSARGHYQLGVILDACRLKEAAQREFRTAIECDPRYWKPYNNLATMLLEERAPQSWVEAVSLLEKALQHAPGDDRTTTLYNLALAYWKSGKMRDSERCAREAAGGPARNESAENARRFLKNFERR